MSLLFPHPLLCVCVSSSGSHNEETFFFLNWMTYNSGNDIIFSPCCQHFFFFRIMIESPICSGHTRKETSVTEGKQSVVALSDCFAFITQTSLAVALALSSSLAWVWQLLFHKKCICRGIGNLFPIPESEPIKTWLDAVFCSQPRVKSQHAVGQRMFDSELLYGTMTLRGWKKKYWSVQGFGWRK